jgi:hypothetical protein
MHEYNQSIEIKPEYVMPPELWVAKIHHTVFG